MRYAALGGLAGFLAGPLLGLPPDSVVIAVIVGAVVVYLGSCLLFPFRVCPYCKDRRRREDSDGNYRGRGCLICGDRPYVRLGARLMGRGGDD